MTKCLIISSCRAYTQANPLPSAYSTPSKHDRNRILCCIYCERKIRRPEWRAAAKKGRRLYIPDSKHGMERMRLLDPNYDPLTNVWMGTSVCSPCTRKGGNIDIRKAKKNLNADSVTIHMAKQCDGSSCFLCKKMNKKKKEKNLHTKEQINPNIPHELPPAKRRKRIVVHPKATPPPTAKLSTDDITSWHQAVPGLSGRAAGKIAAKQQRRHKVFS